jgi:hypothetical protein
MDPAKKQPGTDETIFGDVDLKKNTDIYIHRARLLLFCIAGIALLSLINDLADFEWSFALMFAFFTGMGIWSIYNPVPAFSIVLTIWLGIILYAIPGNPDPNIAALVGMIVLNGLVITLLGLAIREALQLKKQSRTD